MDIHHIHDTEVSFHGEANKEHIVNFLKGEHVKGYLKLAEERGKMNFTDPHSGKIFALEHDRANNSFSVREAPQHHF